MSDQPNDGSAESEQTLRLTTVEGGPFIVNGDLPLRTADYVMSEKGEPMTWSFGPSRTIENGTALCRCGHSDDKPFCDGSHADAEWDSTPNPPDGRYQDRAKEKEGTKLVVTDDRQLCMHAGLCGTEKRTVWSMMKSTDDTEVRATVIRMVEKCPSGRLVNVIDGNVVEPALPASVGVIPGGPLWMTGEVPVELESGETLEVRNRVTLCRCGASSMKPLCDGSHSKIDFDTGD